MDYIQNNIFFFFKDGDLILWDYENHLQYKIDEAHFKRIFETCSGLLPPEDEVTQNLREEGVLLKEKTKKRKWGWDDLSWIYHKGTKNPPKLETTPDNWVDVYLEYCQEKKPPKEDGEPPREKGIPLLPLNQDLFKNSSFYDVCEKRQTSRSFTGEAIKFEDFSSLLGVVFSYREPSWPKQEDYNVIAKHRISPSAGGLHPFEFYIVVNHVETLDPGIYNYCPHSHSLLIIKKGIFHSELVTSLIDQDYAKDLSFGVFFVADFSKIWWKYEHSRGYRLAFLDAGHLSQTFLLFATSMDLLTWLTGAINDTKAEKLLNIESDEKSPIFFVGVGTGKPTSFNDKIISALKSTK